jgi:AbrB family looped-hinge helix DNA binding protein
VWEALRDSLPDDAALFHSVGMIECRDSRAEASRLLVRRSHTSMCTLVYDPHQHRHTCHAVHVRATVVLGIQGRLVVPAEARKELGLAAGDELVLHTEGGRLVIERREDAAKRLRGLYAGPATVGAVEDLLAERRHAAAGE